MDGVKKKKMPQSFVERHQLMSSLQSSTKTAKHQKNFSLVVKFRKKNENSNFLTIVSVRAMIGNHNTFINYSIAFFQNKPLVCRLCQLSIAPKRAGSG